MANTKDKPLSSEKKAKGKNPRAISSVQPAASGTENLLTHIERLSSGRVILLICTLAFAAYANSLGGDFVFDDTEQIVENPDVRSWDNLARAFETHVWAFRERPDVLRVPVPPPYYRPIFTVMLTLEYKLFGLWPQGWHLTSLLLHILCSIGVYYVLLLLSGRNFVAAVSAMLFAVFPIHAESVSWISGMTDPLFGVFFLASFYYYIKFRLTGRRLMQMLSLGLFLLSAFSKETALSLVILIFFYELIESYSDRSRTETTTHHRSNFVTRCMKAARSALPYFAATLLYLIPRYIVLGGMTWKNPHAHQGPFIDTLLTLPFVVLNYLWHLLWPVGLSIAYNTSFVTNPTSARFLLPALALALIAAPIIVYRKKLGREVWHALALIFIPLLPVLDLRQLSSEYLIFDRYLYLSVAGWVYLIALGLYKWLRQASDHADEPRSRKASLSVLRRPAFGSAATVVLVIALTAANARENTNWADSYSLWANAARVRPDFWAAHYNVGLALMDFKRYEEAITFFNSAAAIAPREPWIFDARGRAHDAMGDRESALSNFKRALELDPVMFESLNNLGTVYFKAGDYPSAERYFGEALRVKPQAVAARFNLGMCYARQNRYGEAAREFEQVARMAPEDAEAYYELGLAYEKTGRANDALSVLERGLSFAKSEILADKISDTLKRIQSERN